MKLTINARNMSVTPGITQRIEKKTQTMSRYLLSETEMQVRMRKEKNDQTGILDREVCGICHAKKGESKAS